ncbi:MAG: aldehyde ferredoxin oxidoreductase N-terminal domain-containing protein, partial [candidate division WOR-3 bacterium]
MKQYGGYRGQIGFVDLTSGKVEILPLESNLVERYLGGYGLGCKLLYELMRPGTDPLSPEAFLGFMTGPLTGTRVPGGVRYMVVGKSPLTGGWGDANAGGFFGPSLKFSGFDGVFITGKAESPVLLYIHDGKIEIHDASSLWGRDTFQTEDICKSKYGNNV